MRTDKPTVSNRWTIVLIVLGVILILFFGFRATRMLIHMPPPRFDHGPTPDTTTIRGWMTIDYIANTYDVPADFIFERIGIPMEGNEGKSLSNLNQEYFTGQEGKIIELVSQAILDFREPRGPKDKPFDSKPPEKKP